MATLSSSLLLAFMPGPWEWVIILVIGLLLFGKRLPDVGRSLGKGIVEFKKGLKGIDDEIEDASSRPAARQKPRLTEDLDSDGAERAQTREKVEAVRHDS